ncbi:hypothetical protein LJC52_05930 [Bacteroidales bacterium OttesenSCG-928-A17]|nr:hypothetical protein [Bacteroidales bacterium OttesenSCG-928-A17]
MKILPILFSILSSLIITTSCQRRSSGKILHAPLSAQHDTLTSETKNRPTIFLHGIEIDYDELFERSINGEIFSGTGYTDPRYAIRYYGEKYRNGAMFFEIEEGGLQ